MCIDRVATTSPDIIQVEREWRGPAMPATLEPGRQARIALSRWSREDEHAIIEVSSDSDYDAHVLTICRRRARKEFRIGTKQIWDGAWQPDEMLLTGPRETTWSAVFHGRFDQLRVHFPQALISECHAAAFGAPLASAVSLCDAAVIDDPVLKSLGQAFRALPAYDLWAGPCFADSLGLAFACRLVALHFKKPGPSDRAVAQAVIRPHMRRVLDYIEENLARPIYLADLSPIMGLSRVHFSVQFKAATGMQPHAYILQRRIARAQERLQQPGATIVETALDLGFSSQGHFTAAFRKVVGVPPGRWLNEKTSGIATRERRSA